MAGGGPRICIGASTLNYPHGGGLRWLYLNWALGFAAVGCEVTWLEFWTEDFGREQTKLDQLRHSLEPYGLAHRVAVCDWHGRPAPADIGPTLGFEEVAADTDLFVNLGYFPPSISDRFGLGAFIEQDPGMVPGWVATGVLDIGQHDFYFTIGEHRSPDDPFLPPTSSGWEHVFQAVSIEHWTPEALPPGAAFTTVAHWYAGSGSVADDKRTSFEPYLDLPQRSGAPMELALDLFTGQDTEIARLRRHGWSVQDAHRVARTLEDFAGYVRSSLGEFSCAKPAYVRLGNAWVSDRTICYLASGRPAVVQYTGPSDHLPDSAGIFRFRDPDEAIRHIRKVTSDYDAQCMEARAVAEEFFDAKRVARQILERCLP